MLVRHEYSDEAVWRKALGNKALLYPFALHGLAIDAREYIPAGAMRPYTLGPAQQKDTKRRRRLYPMSSMLAGCILI